MNSTVIIGGYPAPMSSHLPATAMLAQAAIGAAAIALLAVWPPRRGALLLVPLRGSMAEAVNAAVAGHAALIGAGPLPGSIVVFGEQADVSAGIGGKSIMLLAAPAIGCGRIAGGEGRPE